jgi:hypothetical protein
MGAIPMGKIQSAAVGCFLRDSHATETTERGKIPSIAKRPDLATGARK